MPRDGSGVGEGSARGKSVVAQATRVDGNNEHFLVPNAPKKVAPGFNYSRAIQGGKNSPRQQPSQAPQVAKPRVTCVTTRPLACPDLGADTADCYNDKGVDSANRFSVLDILNSIKFNKLITGQDDLYPPDQGLADSREVEVNLLNSNGFYGITDAQKQVILNCMRDFKYVQAEAVEKWSQGEWDFFADKCMELGLDPENNILYPEEDTEIVDVEDVDGFDSGHAVSHLKKLGVYVDPVVSKAPNHNDGEQFGGFGLFPEKAEKFERFAGHWQLEWGLFFRCNLAHKDHSSLHLAGGLVDLVGAQVYSLHLYGYFLGTSMDYKVVSRCLHRLWSLYDLDDITKSPAASPPNAAPSSESDPATVGVSAPHSVSKARALEGVSDGFTTVNRRKKMGTLNLQRKKHNPVRVKIPSQQFAPVRSNGSQYPAGISGIHKTPGTTRDVNKSGVNKPPTVVLNASKKVSKGFNFTRAVQGDVGSKRQQPAPVAMSSKSAAIPKPADLVSSNRFSVLDIPNSIKYNKLIGILDDLYPPDQGLEEGMDLEINKANCSNKFVCQLNREHVDGSRILPESILSPSKQAGESSRGKFYGIPDKQKKDIANRLKDSGSIKADIVDQWCPGQWDYFNDLCTLMGLDPDYCIEDVDSDTENGTSQFLSGLLNSGARSPPFNWKASFYLNPDVAVRMHLYFEPEVGLNLWNIWSCVLLLLDLSSHQLRAQIAWSPVPPRDPVLPSDGGRITRGQIAVRKVSLSKIVENPSNIEDSNQVSVPLHSSIGKSSHRMSSYGWSKSFGALRGKGIGANRSEKGPSRYSSLLSELKVNEFVHETTKLVDCRMGVDNSSKLGLNPSSEGATDDGGSDPSPAVDTLVVDTEMEGLKHPSIPADVQVTDTAYGMFSPRKDSNDVQSIIWDSTNGHFSLSDSISGNDKWINCPPVVGNPGAPTRDSEGFTLVQRRKNKGAIKIQSKKQKPVVIRAAHVQCKAAPTSHVQAHKGSGQNAPDKPSAAPHSAANKGAPNSTCGSSTGGNLPFKGFNFSRAVNGNGGKNSDRNVPSPTATTSPKPILQDNSNRFSVLDIPSSIMCNRLVDDSSDLYPHGMEDDGTENMGIIQYAPKENLICQVNREYMEGVRILPVSIMSPPKPSYNQVANDICMQDPVVQEKDYGITDAQKNAIYNSLRGPSNAVRAVDMAEWEPGEHEYFEDQVKFLNMDMDFCVEDVESDEESGTAKFFSGMLKSGVPKVPVITMPSPFK
ncbi:hypothetical protein L1987_47760 [Smallanthus sonchifolius]|uniref:Uncharacterized protein n=1 Tax=Smallanthus sonchifolius TaxID=185202 RepID=A0ACB9FQX4_9ASTR|nr:hypothetical protein L1987_47760 [Smallanthus sonchifolius]